MKFKIVTSALILSLGVSAWSASTRGRVSKQSVIDKVANKKSVSLYMPWAGISGGVIDTMGLHPHQRIALHGAIHQGTDFFHLKWDTTGTGPYAGNATKFVDSTITAGLALRDSLLALNRNLVIIGEMRVYDAIQSFLPDNSPFWLVEGGKRDTAFIQKTALGNIYYYKLAINNSGWQQQVAKQCAALLETGIFDACLMDWATDDRLGIIQAVRTHIGEDAMLVGNVNHNSNVDKIMPLLNGGYMECVWWGSNMLNPTSGPGYYMNLIQTTLSKANKLMREPKILGTEIWSHPTWNTGLTADFKNIPENEKYLMRAGVAAHYIYANGYVSYFPHGFAGAPYYSEHMHPYDQFLNASLGTPMAEYTTNTNKSLQREWTKATVVYNPVGNPAVTLTFDENRRSQKTGVVGKTFTVPTFDGDFFLKGEYTQMYPVEGVALPKEYALPDTTYKGTIVTGLSRVTVKPSASKLQMLNNQKNIIYKFQVEGEQPRFYNSEGREVELPKGYKVK